MQHDVIALEQLAEGAQQCVQVNGTRILLCRTESGVYAIENRCPHADLPLQGGTVANDVIRCPSHGARFNLNDGNPVVGRLDAVNTFTVEIVEGRILVEL